MKLKDMVDCIETVGITGSTDVEVTGVQYDSRRVEPGNVFIALAGSRTDGHQYLDRAVSQGAVAVVIEKNGFQSGRAASIRVTDTRDALARLSSAFFGFPSRALKVVGVTGTNGKTTFTFLMKSILESAGIKTGLVGTIRYEIGERIIPADRTTPQASELQQMLQGMKQTGCGAVVMEVSSHSLEQKRVEAVDFDVAVFTNLTQDHLDYHGSMEDYFKAKARLFSGLGRGEKQGQAVVRFNDPYSSRIRPLLGKGTRCRTYGIADGAEVLATDMHPTLDGTRFELRTPEGGGPVTLRLCGLYNVENALAAIAAGIALGVPLATAIEGIEKVESVPGRLEAVRLGQPFHVFVDYAHTDDALKNVLMTLKELVKGRLILVFGCGGNRDAGKRPLMGRVAAHWADHAVITSDNPRREDPMLIARQIEAGFDNGCTHEIISDRAEAIGRAVELAEPGDVVLIAGKGHETTQECADTTIPFDDRQSVAGLLKKRIWKN